MTLGEKLKTARLNAGLSQEQLAQKLCVSRQAVTKWENDRGLPDTLNLKSISEMLDVSIDYLLDNSSAETVNVIKEIIAWDKYPTVKKLSNKLREDYVVEDFYQNADSITQLSWTRKLSRKEKILDLTILFVGHIAGTMEIVDHLKDPGIYYLVEQDKNQYLVRIDKEFITSTRMPYQVREKKFVIGDITFSRTLNRVRN